MSNLKKWVKKDTISKISSKWLTVFCEVWDDGSKEMEYWRVEKDASVIIITETDDYFILPKSQFRPGIATCTLDFPGGRFDGKSDVSQVARNIVMRELSIKESDIISLNRLSPADFIVNSSFSNQALIVFSSKVSISHHDDSVVYKKSEYKQLLNDLPCLQCNFALRLWNDKTQ